MTWLAGLGSKLGVYLAAAGVIVLLLLGVFFRGRKSKADEVQAETAKTVIKTAKKGKKIEKANRDSGAKSRRDRLHKYSSDN